MKIHLMEPYRSGLIARGLDEGLIRSSPPEASHRSDLFEGLRVGREATLQQALLQLLVLGSDVTFIWNDDQDAAERRGDWHMRLSGLQTLGVVQPVQGADEAIPGLETAGIRSWDDCWRHFADELDDYHELLLTQLDARGRRIHWSLFRLVRALARWDTQAVPVIRSTVPTDLAPLADALMEGQREAWEFVVLPVVSTLVEVKSAMHFAAPEARKIVGVGLRGRSDSSDLDVAQATSQVWGLVVTRLSKEEIRFPQPASLGEVLALRHDSAVEAFRATLIPFVEAVAGGREDELRVLKRELESAVRALRNYPRAAVLGKWTAYLALPLSAAEVALGVLGVLGLGTSMFAVGSKGLAKRWETQSRWLYLGRRDDKQIDDLFL